LHYKKTTYSPVTFSAMEKAVSYMLMCSLVVWSTKTMMKLTGKRCYQVLCRQHRTCNGQWEGSITVCSHHIFLSRLTHKICAIRETFEESGLLLTIPAAHTVPELDTEIWRHKVHNDASQFKHMCELYKLQPAVDRLVPFANWITPAFEKKRFNTLFFLTVLHQTVDEEHKETVKVSADGRETVQMDWFNPREGKTKGRGRGDGQQRMTSVCCSLRQL
jgi:hypothetical protein